MNVFQKSSAGLSLTPSERAFLKLLENFAIAALVSSWPVIQGLLAQQNINWQAALRTALAAFAVAFLSAVWKYLKAQGDSPLLDAAAPTIQDVLDAVASWGGIPNEVKTGVDASVSDAPAPVPTADPATAPAPTA